MYLVSYIVVLEMSNWTITNDKLYPNSMNPIVLYFMHSSHSVHSNHQHSLYHIIRDCHTTTYQAECYAVY